MKIASAQLLPQIHHPHFHHKTNISMLCLQKQNRFPTDMKPDKILSAVLSGLTCIYGPPCAFMYTDVFTHREMHRHLKAFKCVFMDPFMHVSLCLHITIHLSERQRNIHIIAIFSLHSTFPPFCKKMPEKTDWSKIFCSLAS